MLIALCRDKGALGTFRAKGVGLLSGFASWAVLPTEGDWPVVLGPRLLMGGALGPRLSRGGVLGPRLSRGGVLGPRLSRWTQPSVVKVNDSSASKSARVEEFPIIMAKGPFYL